MLDAVLRCYAVVLQQAHGDVERLCSTLPDTWQMAPRVKTLKTMLEKLQRQPNLHSIGQIRDVAGLRVVVAGTRTDQDDLTDRLALLLADDADPPKVIDRRADPRSGYRAVHLAVTREGLSIEVQVRTDLQHRWVDLFERAADRFGRGIRYGEAAPAGIGEQLVGGLNQLSILFDDIERWEQLNPGMTRTGARQRLDEHFTNVEHVLEQLR